MRGPSNSPNPSFRRAHAGAPTIIVVPRVLIVARHFPPMGGAGVHRTLASVRHLGEHGFEPIVVTGPARRAPRNRWEPLDEGLAPGRARRRGGPPRRDAGARRSLAAPRPPARPALVAWRPGGSRRACGWPARSARRRRDDHVVRAVRDRVRRRPDRPSARAAVGGRPRGPVGAGRDAHRAEPRSTARIDRADAHAR